MDRKIGIIGAGNMGGTFYEGLSKLFSEENLFICDKDQGKLDALGAKNSSTDPNEILKEADVMILAIKPQSFKEFAGELKLSLQYKLVISIMAGVSMETLEDNLGTKRIIRAMPNLPVQVNKGVIGWAANPECEDSDLELAEKMFKVLGKSIQLNHESMLDAITAISGSGPAYFFLLLEMLTDKARGLGFSDEEADIIARQTFLGSAELMKKGDKDAREWKQAVTSPDGVTEAVLEHLFDNQFSEIFDRAIDEGVKRSEELSR